MRTLSSFVVSLACGAVASAEVVETPRGIVEFVGLEEWTAARIQEALGYASADDLHFCAADIKQRLRFPDASVRVYSDPRYTVVTVVEPQRSDLVQWRAVAPRQYEPLDDWRDLELVLSDASEIGSILGGELLQYGSVLAGGGSLPADRVWAGLLRARSTDADFRAALARSADHAESRGRMLAAMILANFHERDQAWHALMSCARDPEVLVRAAAVQALITLSQHLPRKVSWEPAAEDIRHILNGTNLDGLRHVMEVLVATEVDPGLAPSVLRDGFMVRAYLHATREEEREAACALVQRLAGGGRDCRSSDWSAWQDHQQAPENRGYPGDSALMGRTALCEAGSAPPRS